MSHPIHPAIVHFPVACWSLATLADCGQILFGVNTSQLAGVLLITGIASGILAMLAGLIEIAKINRTDNESVRLANLHMGAGITTWSLYAASAFTRFDGTQLTEVTAIGFGLSIAGFVGLAVTGWMGGTLVYKYQVGTQSRKHP
jgi:uncharacterized membrane protein